MEEQEIQDKLNQHRINKAETGNKDSSTKWKGKCRKSI